MTGTWAPPVPGSGDPTTALAAAVEILVRGIDQLWAAVEVEWQAPAAELYRAEVTDVAIVLAQDLLLLEELIRRAGALRAPGGPG